MRTISYNDYSNNQNLHWDNVAGLSIYNRPSNEQLVFKTLLENRDPYFVTQALAVDILRLHLDLLHADSELLMKLKLKIDELCDVQDRPSTFVTVLAGMLFSNELTNVYLAVNLKED